MVFRFASCDLHGSSSPETSGLTHQLMQHLHMHAHTPQAWALSQTGPCCPGTLPDPQPAGSSRVLGSWKPGTGPRLAQKQGPEDSKVPVESWLKPAKPLVAIFSAGDPP